MSDIKTPKVQLRGGFSDRNGISKINTKLQVNDFDERTRVALCNGIQSLLHLIKPSGYTCDYLWSSLCLNIMSDVYCQVVEMEAYKQSIAIENCKNYIKQTILNDDYYSALTLIEYIVNWTIIHIPTRYPIDAIQNGTVYHSVYFNEFDFFNSIFERECVGYRFIDKIIVPITDDNEIEEIEKSLGNPYQGCKSHIKKALEMLSDRSNPDYKNSIKESISSVESICCIIVGKEHATLGDALKILEKKHQLNGQLKSAFEKLYTYTNDEGGIRHANGLFEGNVTFEEAKFMLVSCSAFVNYLIAEYGKIGD